MAATPEHPCDQIVAAVRYLQFHGLTPRQFADIHHFHLNGNVATYADTLRYFSIHRELGANNLNFRDRLVFLVNLHSSGAGGFPELIPRVLQHVPL